MSWAENVHYEESKKEALTWETGTVLKLQKSTRTAWWVATAGVVVGVMGMAAAAVQYTQEPPMPWLLRVDNSTGIVDRVDTLQEGKISVADATSKYFAQRYVVQRESWNDDLAKENYANVNLMSTSAEQQKYAAFYRRSPQSPMKLYSGRAKVSIDIVGTSFIKDGIASVRYIRSIEWPGNPKPDMTHHTATVTFTYSSGRMSEKDRAINPLGFQAEYRTDPDVPPADAVMPAQAETERRLAPAAPLVPAPMPARQPLDLRPLQARRN